MQLTFAHKVSKANSVPDTNFSHPTYIWRPTRTASCRALQLASNAKKYAFVSVVFGFSRIFLSNLQTFYIGKRASPTTSNSYAYEPWHLLLAMRTLTDAKRFTNLSGN